VKLFEKNKEIENAIPEPSKIDTHYGYMLNVVRKNRSRNIRPDIHILKFSFMKGEKPSRTITLVNLGEIGFGVSFGQLNEKNF